MRSKMTQSEERPYSGSPRLNPKTLDKHPILERGDKETQGARIGTFSRAGARYLGAGQAAPGDLADWTRVDGHQPCLRHRTALLDPLPDRRHHRKTPHRTADPAGTS